MNKCVASVPNYSFTPPISNPSSLLQSKFIGKIILLEINVCQFRVN